MQNVKVAQTIKRLCKQNKVSIATLLQECTLTKGFIYDLEKLDKTPSVDKLVRVADYFGCSVDYLLGRTENPEVNS